MLEIMGLLWKRRDFLAFFTVVAIGHKSFHFFLRSVIYLMLRATKLSRGFCDFLSSFRNAANIMRAARAWPYAA